MCLAIAALAGKLVPEDHLRSGWRGNKDGAGFAFVSDGKVEISKGYSTVDALLVAYKKAFDENSDSPFLIHFRTATHGKTNAENTHPFTGKYGALIHNGIFYGLGNSTASDTAEFAEFIQDVPEEKIPKLLEAFEGVDNSWSKLAILGHSGTFYFMREKSGMWENGIWYSNYGYRSGNTDRGGAYCGN